MDKGQIWIMGRRRCHVHCHYYWLSLSDLLSAAMRSQVPQPSTCARFSQSQNLELNPGKSDPPAPKKKKQNVGGAGLHWAHSVWASRSKRKMGVGELNERLFIRELNAAEYFLSAVKRLNICHWKALSAHAKMKSTAASLCGSVLADKKNVAGRTFPMSRAVNWLDFPPGSLHTWWVRAASETCSLRRVSMAMHKFPYIALAHACLYIHLL